MEVKEFFKETEEIRKSLIEAWLATTCKEIAKELDVEVNLVTKILGKFEARKKKEISMVMWINPSCSVELSSVLEEKEENREGG